MEKQEVEALYQEVKRRKMNNSGKQQGLIEPRPKKKCNCGGKAKNLINYHVIRRNQLVYS